MRDIASRGEPDQKRMFRKIFWRLMPIVTLGFLIAQIDKMNVSFAKLRMLDDLGFSEQVYGLGATIFLIGYTVFSVPSNVLQKKFGARAWLGFLMFAWGTASILSYSVRTPFEFYAIRFLLGIAEAGFYPGVVSYLASWFTKEYRTRAIAIFMTAAALAGVIAGPVSGWILSVSQKPLGLAGWQWLFIVEGIPAIALAIWCWFSLITQPEDARWLNESEKALHGRLMAAEAASVQTVKVSSIMKGPRVWVLGAIFGANNMLFFAVLFWLPTLIAAAGTHDPRVIGSLSAVCWLAAAICMLIIAAIVDRGMKPHKMLAGIFFVSAVSWLLTPLAVGSLLWSVLVMSVSVVCITSAAPVFWNLPTAAYKGATGAVAVAFIMTQAQCYTFASPSLIAYLKQSAGSNSVMYFLAGISLIAALLTEFYQWYNERSARRLSAGGSLGASVQQSSF